MILNSESERGQNAPRTHTISNRLWNRPSVHRVLPEITALLSSLIYDSDESCPLQVPLSALLQTQSSVSSAALLQTVESPVSFTYGDAVVNTAVVSIDLSQLVYCMLHNREVHILLSKYSYASVTHISPSSFAHVFHSTFVLYMGLVQQTYSYSHVSRIHVRELMNDAYINSRINEWCIYKALYCVLLYTQSALQSCGGGGGSLLNHHQCAASIWMLTTHQLQVESRESHRVNQVYALTTHQLQVESRESHRVNQVDGDY